MPDYRRTRSLEPGETEPAPITSLYIPYLNDPVYTPPERTVQGLGGAGNEGMGASPVLGSIEDRLDTIQQLGAQRSDLENQIANLPREPESSGFSLGNVWDGLKQAGSSVKNALGAGLNAITPTQEGYNDFAMRLQNASAIANGGTPLWMQQMQMGSNQDLLAMKRQQLAQQLSDHQAQLQRHHEDQAIKIWADTNMPLAMKKKMSQQLAMQGNTLAGNLARLGDEQLIAEMDVLAPFLPKGKGEELTQMMSKPNADLEHVERWVNFAREQKKAVGDQRMKSERFTDLLSRYHAGEIDPMSPEYDEFKQGVLEREKRQQENAEMKLKLDQLGLSNKKSGLDLQDKQLELAAKQVMPQYGPEVDLVGGVVQRDKYDPRTGQLSTVKGNKPPASVTNIDMKQRSAFEDELGKIDAKDIKDTQVKARDSAAIIRNIHQGRQLLDSGMITGTGAEFLTKAGQTLQQIGFMKEKDPISNTQAYAALMAQNVAKHIKEFGAGTGLSDADREYATKMAGGDVTLNEAALRKILDLNETASRNMIKLHNKSVKGIKSIIPLEVEEPPEYSRPQKQMNPMGPFSDPEKEKRYQEWKRKQGK